MKKRNFTVNFEKEDLNKFVLDEGSCVVLKQCTHHFALHPYHLNNINESLKSILNKGIAKYDKSLDGILLGYQNVKLLSTTGSINNDTCFIHVDISADFYLFKPEVDKTLTGIVNKKSEDHVGCLVHTVFNVSLPKPLDEDDWIGSLVQIGQEILFRITFVDLEGRLPYIRATFISILSELDSGISTGEDTKPSKSTKKSKGKKIIFNSNSEDEVKIPEVKKKKKKRKSSEHISFEELGEALKHSDDVEPANESYKTSKKRKRKHTNDEIETSYEDPEVLKHKESKKSKKKRQKLNCDTSEETNLQTPSHKHKKKHKSRNSF